MNARSLQIAMVFTLVLTMFSAPRVVAASDPLATYSISDGVTAEDSDLVREGIAAANTYLVTTYGRGFLHPLMVNVRTTSHPSNPGIVAFASDNFLVVFTGAPSWTGLSPALRLEVVIHELIHTYEYDLIGGEINTAPMWFIEGMAEYVAFDVVEDMGVLRATDIHDAQTWAVARAIDSMSPLYELEGIVEYQSASGPVYNLSYLATEWLAKSAGDSSLNAFLQSIAAGDTWTIAFRSAFGMTPDTFYERFQRWLVDDMLAPSHTPDAFAVVGTIGGDADVSIVSAPQSAEPGDQIVVIARTAPEASCRFELRDGDGVKIDSVRTIADGAGVAFWLDTVPADLEGTAATIVAGCGGERDRVGISISE